MRKIWQKKYRRRKGKLWIIKRMYKETLTSLIEEVFLLDLYFILMPNIK
jgi:hypothetical protein